MKVRVSGAKRLSLRVSGAAIATLAGLGVLAPTAPAFADSPAPPPQAVAKLNAAVSNESVALQVLSASDAKHYREAFAAAQRGDFGAASALSGPVADPCLKGRLSAVRLLNPDYRASYAELSGWLAVNAELPEAQRVYDLAMKRKPAAAPPPRSPAGAAPSAVALGERVSRSLQGRARAPSGEQQAARAAFYAGDVQRAYELGSSSGERWIAGLAAMRLKRYPDAIKALEPLSNDVSQTPWTRSGAAYWAARAASAEGQKDQARAFLKTASRSPDTFYGLIAARELDKLQAKAPSQDAIADLFAATSLDAEETAQFVRTDPRARRVAALIQIGLPLQAGEELRTAMATASDADRPRLTSLALALNAPLGSPDEAKAGWARFNAGSFPTPVLTPLGGFTIDKALVYALVRQESRFNPNAASGSAYGLMQLTAETAARLAGDEKLRHNPAALRDPGLNLKLGQAYVAKILGAVKGDVMRAVAAYNSGPGVVEKLAAKMGPDADSFMLVESMPSAQTRDYVQRVMAYYWTYRQIFGLDTQALGAATPGAKAITAAAF
jgi:soluble lytic murein transglycosylase-like protein